MSVHHQLFETISKISVFIGKCCGVFYFTAILLSVYEVILRYIFDAPTAWAFEVIMILVGLAWLLSIGAVTQQNRHITVTFLEIVVSKKVWRIMQKIAIILSLLAVLGLLWAAFPPAIHAIKYVERSGSAFNPPSPSLMKVMLAVACILYILQLMANLFRKPLLSDDTDISASKVEAKE